MTTGILSRPSYLYPGLGMYVGSILLLAFFRIPCIRYILEGDSPQHWWYYWLVHFGHGVFIVVYSALLSLRADKVDMLSIFLWMYVLLNLIIACISTDLETIDWKIVTQLTVFIVYANVAAAVYYNDPVVHRISVITSITGLIICITGLVVLLFRIKKWNMETDFGTFIGILCVAVWQLGAAIVTFCLLSNVIPWSVEGYFWSTYYRTVFYFVQPVFLVGAIIAWGMYHIYRLFKCLGQCCVAVKEEVEKADKELRLYQGGSEATSFIDPFSK